MHFIDRCPWNQFIQSRRRPIIDELREDVSKPVLGTNAIEFARLNQRSQQCPIFSAFLALSLIGRIARSTTRSRCAPISLRGPGARFVRSVPAAFANSASTAAAAVAISSNTKAICSSRSASGVSAIAAVSANGKLLGICTGPSSSCNQPLRKLLHPRLCRHLLQAA